MHDGMMRQTLIARFALDPLISKDRQLTLFLNLAYLGNVDGKPVTGFVQAARAYYGKSFHELTEDEYISLVAMLIAPSRLHIKKRPEDNADRVRRMTQVVAGD